MDIVPPEDQTRPGFAVKAGNVSWVLAIAAILLGALMVMSPKWWFGPSWSSYFQLLHMTGWIGLAWILLGWHEVMFLTLRTRINLLAYLYLGGGVSFTVLGSVLFVAGLAGRDGLWEAPYMILYGGVQIAHSISMVSSYRQELVAARTDDWDDE